MDAAPKQDIEDLEQHRAEARQYLPKSDEDYQAEIDAGTDPYTGRWLAVTLYALGISMLLYASAEMAGWV